MLMKQNTVHKISLPGLGQADVIKSSRRSMQIEVSPDGSLVLRVPRRCPYRSVMMFVKEKRDWIEKKRAEFEKNSIPYKPKKFVDGEHFWFLGREYPLNVVEEDVFALYFENEKFFLAEKWRPKAQNLFIDWYRKKSECIIENRTRELAAEHGFSFSRFRISGARKRWGSCSFSGVLSFSWRLVMAAPEVIDMIIFHELCHLKVPNHSPKFKKLLASYVPEYREFENWLKRHSYAFEL